MAGRLARMGQQRYLDVVKVDGAGQPRGRWNGTFREVPEVLDLPLRTRKPTCYFVNSMSDLFGEGVSDEYIAKNRLERQRTHPRFQPF
jgi:protein gp37